VTLSDGSVVPIIARDVPEAAKRLTKRCDVSGLKIKAIRRGDPVQNT